MRAWLLASATVACGLGVAAAGQLTPASFTSPKASAPASDPTGTLAEDTNSRVFLTAEDGRRAAEAGLLPVDARSILKVPGTLRHGEFVWDDEGVPPGPIRVHVDLRRQLVSVFRGSHEIGSAVTLYGTDKHETPLGRFPIVTKLEDHWSATYDAPMPYTLRLTNDGIAVHGSDVRKARATHGCVGVPLEFARLLFEQARLGDIVEIVFSEERQA